MKTLAIPTLGWTDGEVEAFEQYCHDVALEYDANITVCHTVDCYFEIDLETDLPEVEYLFIQRSVENDEE